MKNQNIKDAIFSIAFSIILFIRCDFDITNLLNNANLLNNPNVFGSVSRTMINISGLFFGVLLGIVGLKLGRWFRAYFGPDFISANSTSALVRGRIFWAIGPQFIGLLVGTCIGIYLAMIAILYLMQIFS